MHVKHAIPELSQVNDTLTLGNHVDGSVLQSQSEGLVKLLKQDLLTLGNLQLAEGVAAEDAVVMSQLAIVDSRVAALETLLASDDLSLDEAQEWVNFMKDNAADIASLSTSLNAAIAAVQADVDANEADSDAAEAALDSRAVTLEAFKNKIDSAIDVVFDGTEENTVIRHDVLVNQDWYANGIKVLNAARKLQNIVSLDAATDAVVSATAIAHTDALEAKLKARDVTIYHNNVGASDFATMIPAGVTVERLAIKVITPFDGSATLSVGNATDAGFFKTIAGNDAAILGQVGVNEFLLLEEISADMQPRFTLSGNPSVGEMYIMLTIAG